MAETNQLAEGSNLKLFNVVYITPNKKSILKRRNGDILNYHWLPEETNLKIGNKKSGSPGFLRRETVSKK